MNIAILGRRTAIGSLVVLASASVLGAAASPHHGQNHDDDAVVTHDWRYSADVDDLHYGNPAGAVDSYTAYMTNLEATDPNHWGGGYIDGDHLVIVYVGQSKQDANSSLRKAGVSGAVTLTPGNVSVSAFNAAIDAVSEISGLAGTIGAIGPDYQNQRLVVEFVTPQTVASLTSVALDPTADPEPTVLPTTAAPAEAVTPEIVTPHSLETSAMQIESPTVSDLDAIDAVINIPFVATDAAYIPQATSRYYDTSPYYGGAAIRLANTANTQAVLCTTGFSWTPPSGTSGQFIVTASHCAMDGDATNRSVVSKYVAAGGTSAYGSVVWRSGDDNGTVTGRKGDVAVIKLSSGTTAARVFHGTYDTTGSKVTKSAVVLPAGWKQSSSSTMFTSGAGPKGGNGTGQFSPDRVTKTNYTMIYFDGILQAREQKFTGLTVAEHVSTCTSHGDSGGAVYTVDSTGARPVGIISGNNLGGAGLTNCWNFYTPLSAVSGYYGGSVKTG